MAFTKKRATSKSLTVRLPLNVTNYLARAQKKQNRNASEIVRDALERLMQADNSGSLWDRIADLVVETKGPSDLSTNKKHMRGFGE